MRFFLPIVCFSSSEIIPVDDLCFSQVGSPTSLPYQILQRSGLWAEGPVGSASVVATNCIFTHTAAREQGEGWNFCLSTVAPLSAARPAFTLTSATGSNPISFPLRFLAFAYITFSDICLTAYGSYKDLSSAVLYPHCKYRHFNRLPKAIGHSPARIFKDLNLTWHQPWQTASLVKERPSLPSSSCKEKHQRGYYRHC